MTFAVTDLSGFTSKSKMASVSNGQTSRYKHNANSCKAFPSFFGMEFQSLAPSYIKLFFTLLVRGCGQQKLPEIFHGLYFFITPPAVGKAEF